MNKGYTVENEEIEPGDNCILVISDKINNCVINLPLCIKYLRLNMIEDEVGVWKIKELKK